MNHTTTFATDKKLHKSLVKKNYSILFRCYMFIEQIHNK